VDFALAEAELKQAMFNGLSVWDRGFNLTLTKNTGALTCLEIIRDFFTKLSTYDGRYNPHGFVVNIRNIDWSTYLDQWENYELPIWSIGWLPDFADADNYMRPYMHSNGDFSYFQNYTLANGCGSTHGSNYPTLNKDELIDKAFVTPDGSDRAKMYQDLESIYMADCPSLPLPTPMGRRWCQYWVKGWYYDALYPAFYIRDYFKMDNCWYDVTGPNMAVSDGIVNMRDIQYLIIHFNAKPSVPGKPDPNWVGTYGNGGVDPSGDRLSNMRDIQGTILHFNHQHDTLTP
jgi:peptide/nickel transport system substrate-binding protein